MERLNINIKHRNVSIEKFEKAQKTKYKDDIAKGPYQWIKFPSEENAIMRKFREAVVIDPKRYVEDIHKVVEQKTFDTEMVVDKRRMTRIPKRITRSLFDEDPHILDSGAKLQKKIESTFGRFVNEMQELFSTEQQQQVEKMLKKRRGSHDSEHTSKGSIKIPSRDDYYKQKNIPSWKKLSEKIAKNNQWNKNDEEYMMDHIREMRVRLAKYSRTAPWKKVIMGSIHKIRKKPEEIKVKEQSFRKLKEMPYPEFSKWISTLATLNECVDKEYLNECLKKMTQEEIEAIKTEISNKIIEEYRSNQSKNEKKRFNYFANNVEQTKSKRPKTAAYKSL